MLTPYSVAICSMWSLSSLYCSGKENRIIPEDGVQEWPGSVCTQVRDEAAGPVTSALRVSRNTHMEVGICSQEHGCYWNAIMCGVWLRAAKRRLGSSDGCLERGEALRPPNGCRHPYAHTASLPGWERVTGSSEHRCTYQASAQGKQQQQTWL